MALQVDEEGGMGAAHGALHSRGQYTAAVPPPLWGRWEEEGDISKLAQPESPHSFTVSLQSRLPGKCVCIRPAWSYPGTPIPALQEEHPDPNLLLPHTGLLMG